MAETLLVIIAVVIAVLLLVLLFWIAKISFMLQKSLNELIKGMNSVDERLCGMQEAFRSGKHPD